MKSPKSEQVWFDRRSTMRSIQSSATLLAIAIFAGQLMAAVFGAGGSQPVPDGARVALVCAHDGSFLLGDAIDLTFVLSNGGTQSFRYETGGDYRGTGFPTRYKFTVVDEQGVALPAEPEMNMGGLGWPRDLPPGGEHRESLRLQNHVRADRPGIFTVRVTHDFGWKATAEKPLPVAETKVTITLPTPEQAEQRVRSLAANQEPLKANELGAFWYQTEFRYLSHPIFLPGLERCAGEGTMPAMEGIQRMQTKEATLALMRLLDSKNTNVVHAAALFLCRRMPARVVGGYPRTLGWYGTQEDAAAFRALWVPEAAGPLRAAAAKLLRSGDVKQVNTGAFIVEAIGEPEDAPVVLEALGKELADWNGKVRASPEDNILNSPGAVDALVNALAGLRERGYRAPSAGGVAVIMARFLELADPKVPRGDGWEQLLEAFFTQNPAMLREAAVRALPKPPTGSWEKLLMGALSDADRGVMMQACKTAGETGNPVFVEPLANIVRTERHEWVVRAASGALTQLGAHWAAVDAWIERLVDEKLYTDGLQFLADKLAHPKSGGSSGRTDLPREGRVALRAKWQRFFADSERQALVQSGKPVPVSEDQARDLFNGVLSLSIEGGKSWPASNP